MQKNILWTGREYYSLENCLINMSTNGIDIRSTILGYYENKIYKVSYFIHTNPLWETQWLEIECHHNNYIQVIQLEKTGNGEWLKNGQKEEAFSGCIDVDIPLTPFTNTLPINRLKLKKGNEETIEVIYMDLLGLRTLPVQQKYIKISDREYHYENVPNDFEATIQTDEWGLVIDYPTLFKRSAMVDSHYEWKNSKEKKTNNFN